MLQVLGGMNGRRTLVALVAVGRVLSVLVVEFDLPLWV
jgi:hypothetical protein